MVTCERVCANLVQVCADLVKVSADCAYLMQAYEALALDSI